MDLLKKNVSRYFTAGLESPSVNPLQTLFFMLSKHIIDTVAYRRALI